MLGASKSYYIEASVIQYRIQCRFSKCSSVPFSPGGYGRMYVVL